MKDISLKENISQNNKSFIMDDGFMYAFPLISIEKEEINSRSEFKSGEMNLDIVNEELSKLKTKLLETNEYKFLFNYVFSLQRMLSLMTIYNVLLMSKTINNIESCFENTKRFLRILFRTSQPSKNWWRETDPEIEKMGGNEGLYQEQSSNIKPSGADPSYAGMAAMTMPIMIKGIAENYDPAYKLIKNLFNVGAANLNWADVFKVMPMNLIPFAFGPPLTSYGAMALGMDLLPGERRAKENREREKNYKDENLINNIEDCKKGENK